MYFNRKNSQINVFTGSPWEAASIHSLLNTAFIEASLQETKHVVAVSVPSEYYTAAVRLMSDRNYI